MAHPHHPRIIRVGDLHTQWPYEPFVAKIAPPEEVAAEAAEPAQGAACPPRKRQRLAQVCKLCSAEQCTKCKFCIHHKRTIDQMRVAAKRQGQHSTFTSAMMLGGWLFKEMVESWIAENRKVTGSGRPGRKNPSRTPFDWIGYQDHLEMIGWSNGE
jgi:hypothetical protein